MWNVSPECEPSVLHYTKIHCVACPLIFVTACIGPLENFGLLNYTDLPNVDMFHNTVLKICNVTTFLLRKVLGLGVVKPCWWIQVSQSSGHQLESSHFIINNKYCQLCYSDSLTLLICLFFNVVRIYSRSDQVQREAARGHTTQ